MKYYSILRNRKLSSHEKTESKLKWLFIRKSSHSNKTVYCRFPKVWRTEIKQNYADSESLGECQWSQEKEIKGPNKIFRSVQLFSMHHHNVNQGPLVIIVCWCRFLNCKQIYYTGRDNAGVDNEGRYAHVGTRVVWEISEPSIQFSGKYKAVLK